MMEESSPQRRPASKVFMDEILPLSLRKMTRPERHLSNFDRALDQKIERVSLLALLDDELAGIKASPLVALK